MARTLSNKVEHCPKCRKLKRKNAICTSCGYGAATETEHIVNLGTINIPANTTGVMINGKVFRR